jgi:putative phage-type endonuclease
MKQGTDEWFQARLGKVTASRVIDIVKGARGYRASRENYIAQIVAETLTGQPLDSFTTPAMERGKDLEPLARSAYEAVTLRRVQEVGFVEHPEINGLGASPDGLVGDDGGIEIKCPNTATHLDTLLHGTIKRDYIYQMQTCMMCTNRKWWDFVSYDPRMPDKHAIKIIRVERDEEMIDEITRETGSVLAEVAFILDKLR